MTEYKNSVFIRCKRLEDGCPEDVYQDDEIAFSKRESIPIPSVGDSVEYKYSGQVVAAKVVTRHFEYSQFGCTVTLVVSDISNKDLASRTRHPRQ